MRPPRKNKSFKKSKNSKNSKKSKKDDLGPELPEFLQPEKLHDRLLSEKEDQFLEIPEELRESFIDEIKDHFFDNPESVSNVKPLSDLKMISLSNLETTVDIFSQTMREQVPFLDDQNVELFSHAFAQIIHLQVGEEYLNEALSRSRKAYVPISGRGSDELKVIKWLLSEWGDLILIGQLCQGDLEHPMSGDKKLLMALRNAFRKEKFEKNKPQIENLVSDFFGRKINISNLQSILPSKSMKNDQDVLIYLVKQIGIRTLATMSNDSITNVNFDEEKLPNKLLTHASRLAKKI